MPILNKASTDYTDKLAALDTAKNDKVESLSPDIAFESVKLTSFRDLDSPGFEGITGGIGGTSKDGTTYDKTGQESLDRIDRIDSYEVFPDSEYTRKYLYENDYGIKKMDAQRTRLAGTRGVDVDQVTNEDVFEEGAKGALKSLSLLQAYSGGDADYIEQVRQWEPPAELTKQWRTNPFTLGSKEALKDLDIMVERAALGTFEHYGRPKSLVRGKGSEQLLGVEGAGYTYDLENLIHHKPLPEDGAMYQGALEDEATSGDWGDRVSNLGKRLAGGIAKELVIDFSDMIGEGLDYMSGGKVGWDHGTSEEKEAWKNSAFGINPYYAEKEFAQAKVHADSIASAVFDPSKEVDFDDAYELVKLGVTTPELFVDSAAFLVTMVIPVLGWGGKAASASKVVKATNKALDAGQITKAAAKVKVAEALVDVNMVNKSRQFIQSNAGLMQLSANNVNDQIDDYKTEQGAAPSIAKIGQMFVTEALLLGMDRWADLSVLRSPAALKGVRDAFTTLAPAGKAKVLAKAIGVAGGLTVNMGKEAGQEYLQEIGQEFNVKFNFDDNDKFLSVDTLDEAIDVVSTEEMQAKGFLGAGLGAGGAVQFAGVGAIGSAIGLTGKGVDNLKDFTAKESIKSTAPESVQSEESITEEDAVTAKKAYGTLLTRLSSDVAEGKINTTNVYSYLDDLDELNSTMHVISTSSPGKVKEGTVMYNSLLDNMEQFVTENADIKLSKRIVRTTVQESLDAQTEAEASESPAATRIATSEVDYDDATRAIDAERMTHRILGSGRVYDDEFMANLEKYAETNNVSKARFQSIVKSYTSVDEEATRGGNGYLAQSSNLQGLIDSSNPKIETIKKKYGTLVQFQAKTDSSTQELTRGIKAAEDEAALRNKSSSIGKKSKPVVTEYMKYNPKTKAYDDPFVINVSKGSDGKWVAQTEQAMKLVATKTQRSSDIAQELTTIAKRGDSKFPGIFGSLRTINIPVKEGARKKERLSDESYYTKVSNTLKGIGSVETSVTKIVLGNTSSPKWKEGGDYRKANMHLVNTENYTSDDVVAVNSLGTFAPTKGGTFLRPDIAVGKDADVAKMTVEQRSFRAAVEAGATIVFDRELLKFNPNSKEGKQAKRSNRALKAYLKDQGYVSVEGVGSQVMVKENEGNKEAVTSYKESIKSDLDTAKKVIRAKKTLGKLYRSLNSGVDHLDGTELKGKRLKEITASYDALVTFVAKADFKDNVDNLITNLQRVTAEEVETLATDILNESTPSPLDYKDKSLEKAVSDYIADQVEQDTIRTATLAEWKEATDGRRLAGKERDKTVTSLLEKAGMVAKSLVESILGPDKSFANGKPDLYERMYMDPITKETVVRPQVSNMTKEEFTEFLSKKSVEKGRTLIPVGIRPVVQDPAKLLKVSRTTVLNSIPIESLPFTLRNTSEAFGKAVNKALKKVTAVELSDSSKVVFDLHNSPARGIVFNKDGKVNPEVMAAMYLSLGEAFTADMSKMLRGYKPDVDVALMFGVQESEINDEMRKMARESGVLLKTLANTLGKSTLKQLGLSKLVDDNTSGREFEALVSDLGNIAVLGAESMGLLESKTADSNDLSALYKNGIIKKAKTVTHFVHVKDKENTVGKFTNKVPVEAVDKFTEGHKVLVKTFPESSVNVKGPFFTVPEVGGPRLTKAHTEIRNDIAGIKVPEEAKETLTTLMSTEYAFDLERVTEFLDAVDADGSNVKVLLGYVDLEDPENSGFNKMYFRDKDVQESKNRDIERTIEELRVMKTYTETTGDSDHSLYFDYFYAGNNRYMLDSNTINPQVDKIHRFLVVPALHKTEYTLAKNKQGGLLFKATSSTDENTDQSYTVRLAIAQALGQGVDKLDSDTVIEFSDAVLSMSEERLATAKQDLLTSGKHIIVANNKEFKLEAEHLTHSLQAFDFLDKVKAAEKEGGDATFVSSLSLEFDSLTSGFANKIQQMPILKNMSAQFARTGVITEAFQKELKDNDLFKGAGKEFNPALGHSMSDVLFEGTKIGFLDSYQNLANITIQSLKTGEKQRENLTNPVKDGGTSGTAVFESLKGLLPGGDISTEEGAAVEITKSIRNLFKDPFMIFNYSAGISRIVKNLGSNVAHDIAKVLATADLSLEKNAHVKTAIENLLESVTIYAPNTDKEAARQVIKTPIQLQEVLRTVRLQAIPIKKMLIGKVPSDKENEDDKDESSTTLEDALVKVVSLTYGEIVKDVFKEEFEPFIDVQDSMNDAYKVAFRIFDSKRVDKLKKLQLSKPNHMITQADHAKVLEELWDDFPWIVGPLTGSAKKGDVVKDVIAIVTTSTSTPNDIDSSRKKPQTPLAESKGKNPKTRTVSPLVRYLEEAVSSGSVLPFHAIDGAEISKTINALKLAAFAAIHDALIGPIDQSDNLGFQYQKGMEETNSKYVLADALAGFADRIAKTIESSTFSEDFKDLPSSGLKTSGKGKEKDKKFPAAATEALANLRKQIGIIKAARELYYGKDGNGGGLLENAWYHNLVGGPGSAWKKGMAEPDLAYKDVFEELYSKYDLEDQGADYSNSELLIATAYGKLTSVQKTFVVGLAKDEGMKDTDVSTFVKKLIEEHEAGVGLAPEIVVKLKSRVDRSTSERVKESFNTLITALESIPDNVQDEVANNEAFSESLYSVVSEIIDHEYLDKDESGSEDILASKESLEDLINCMNN
jgi:DNA-binding transcriptional ArsR family regulator